jgi:predicted nucleic acid-binding protein
LTLVDTNVLIDILEVDPKWADHSAEWLSERRSLGPLMINEIVYAELAAGFTARQSLDLWIVRMRLTHVSLTQQALFLAGQAFRKYRRAGGPRGNVLADFFIGAQASVEGWPILTRDAKRYRTYFPEVTLLGA